MPIRVKGGPAWRRGGRNLGQGEACFGGVKCGWLGLLWGGRSVDGWVCFWGAKSGWLGLPLITGRSGALPRRSEPLPPCISNPRATHTRSPSCRPAVVVAAGQVEGGQGHPPARPPPSLPSDPHSQPSGRPAVAVSFGQVEGGQGRPSCMRSPPHDPPLPVSQPRATGAFATVPVVPPWWLRLPWWRAARAAPSIRAPSCMPPPPLEWLTLSPSCCLSVVVAETAEVEGGQGCPQHQICHHPAGRALDHGDDDVSPQVMAEPAQQVGRKGQREKALGENRSRV